MGNYRSGNKYRVAIGLETSLGSGNTHLEAGSPPTLSVRWDDLTVMPVKLELSPDRQLIDTNYKTGTSQATAYEQVQGVADGKGADLLTDGFGMIAMVALAPLIALQLLGIVYKYKSRKR